MDGDGDIELDELEDFDDVEVVEVTGRGHRDRRRKRKHYTCDWSPSLRAITIMIFAAVAIVYIIAVVIGIVLIYGSLEDLDTSASNYSINRLAVLIESEMGKIQEFTIAGSEEYFAGAGFRQYIKTAEDPTVPEDQKVATLQAMRSMFDTKVVNKESFGFTCPIGVNFYALLDVNLNTLVDWFYPGNSTHLCGDNMPAPPPVIKPETYEKVLSTPTNRKAKGLDSGWLSLIIPDGGDTRPLLISIERYFVSYYILDPYMGPPYDIGDPRQYGYVVFGRSLFPRLGGGDVIADEVPTCVTIEDGKNDADKWDEEDKKMFAQAKAGIVTTDKIFNGVATFAERPNATITATRGRVCPADPLFDSTDTLMCGYMKLCSLDPEVYGEEHCVKIRVDRPMAMLEEGKTPIISLSLEIIALMVALCIIFVVFLDCVVLRRIEALSNVIRTQTREHRRAQEEEDETSVAVSVAEERRTAEIHGKTGKSSSGSSGTSVSGTSETSAGSGTSVASNASGPTRAPGVEYDEIGDLKRAMEQNAIGLRKRLEAVNDTIKSEQIRVVHHKQAMQLLNLWCGRKDFFPGLRPNAMQLRYEPSRNLDDILNNPLAIEYLKNHCNNDRNLENIWFLLDVAWLEELENAEDNEEDVVKRGQIHDIAVGAAKSIIKRYIALNAPQQINISSATYKRLREKGEEYTRKMFDEAVSEVKLMLNTDILPRFQKTNAYSAMSETLYIDSSGGNEQSSELSDETVSTVGSILTDDASEGGEPNVGRLFAQTFKNLHTTFNVGHDDSSTRSNSIAGPSGSVIPDSQTETTTAHGADDRDKDDSDELSEKEPPKLSEDERQKGSESNKSQSSDSLSGSSSAAGDASE